MKKISLFAVATVLALAAFAQNEKYLKAMEPKIAMLDTTRNGAVLLDLANSFERIATAEKGHWQPYYYAALAQANYGMSKLNTNGMGGDPAQIDPIADKAAALLAEAEKMSPNNSEIFVVHKVINSLRMLVDPMNRYMTYGPAAAEALEKAKSLNPDNPRVYLLEGQDKYFTPEQFGGSKTEAKKLFETAMQKYASFKAENSLTPTWGKYMAQYFMAEASK